MEDDIIKILVVDDEEDLCEILQFNLESKGYSVSVANSAEEALKLELESFQLFMLDVMMGGMSGFRLAEKIRKEMKLTIPIIFLTARGTENDLLTGFNIGADDYISKPFSINEVVARVNAVVKRALDGAKQTDLTYSDGDIVLNTEKKNVSIGSEEIELTRKEFEILSLLLKNRDRIFSRNEIMNRVWSDEVIVSERTIDVNITRLRKKLGESGKKIRNKSGYGYFFKSLDD